MRSIDAALRAALEGSIMEEMEENETTTSSVTPEFVELALAWGRRALIKDERRIARLEGREEGKQEGREEGKQAGREEGFLLARRELQRLLTRVGLQPSAEQTRQICECSDLSTLDR